MKIRILTALAAVALTGPSSAQVLQQRSVSMELAGDLAKEAVEACAKDRYNVTAAVVDRSGILRALLRADQAGVHTTDAAFHKTYTAASARTPTSTMAENVRENPDAAQLVANEGFLVLAGGVPLKVGGDDVEAIGVGGALGGQLDEACGLAAIEALKDRLK